MPKDPYKETPTPLKNAMLIRDVDYLQKRLHSAERLVEILLALNVALLIGIIVILSK